MERLQGPQNGWAPSTGSRMDEWHMELLGRACDSPKSSHERTPAGKPLLSMDAASWPRHCARFLGSMDLMASELHRITVVSALLISCSLHIYMPHHTVRGHVLP